MMKRESLSHELDVAGRTGRTSSGYRERKGTIDIHTRRSGGRVRSAAAFTVMFVALAVMCAYVAYVQSGYTASAVVSVHGEEGAYGKNPDGTPFALAAFCREDIVREAITAKGLEGEIVPKALLQGIRVVPKATTEDTQGAIRVSASYIVSLTLPDAYCDRVESKALLVEILKAHQGAFLREHVVTAKALIAKEEVWEPLDYEQAGFYLNMLLTRALGYLDMRMEQTQPFVTAQGQTFQALKKRAENLQAYELADYMALVRTKGLTKDAVEKRARVVYRIGRLSAEYKRHAAQWEIYADLMADYDGEIPGVWIPAHDGQRGYILPRSQSAIDEFALNAAQEREQAQEIRRQMLSDARRISKLKDADRETLGQAEQMFSAIKAKYDELTEGILQLESIYDAEKERGYLSFLVKEPSFLERIQIGNAILISAGICVLARVIRGMIRKMLKRGEIDERA